MGTPQSSKSWMAIFIFFSIETIMVIWGTSILGPPHINTHALQGIKAEDRAYRNAEVIPNISPNFMGTRVINELPTTLQQTTIDLANPRIHHF